MIAGPRSALNRREFLQTTGAALVVSQLAHAAQAPAAAAAPRDARTGIIPDTGWRLWPDQRAEWQNDTIYLPGEVRLASLPVNAPTGGWDILSATQGIPVTLPCTVEQYYWGLQGLRPYKDEYRFETADDEVKNGAYYGVSWWWRSIEIPEAFAGKRIFLSIRGARQRAEVYLNRKLVGYSILEESHSNARSPPPPAPARPINSLSASRTPADRLDWVDGARITWGNATFQKSHGFGGLDRALTLTAHGPARIRDAWVLNTPEPRRIAVHAEIENTGPAAADGRVRFAVVDPTTGHEVAHTEIPAPSRRIKPQPSRPNSPALPHSSGIWTLRISIV